MKSISGCDKSKFVTNITTNERAMQRWMQGGAGGKLFVQLIAIWREECEEESEEKFHLIYLRNAVRTRFDAWKDWKMISTNCDRFQSGKLTSVSTFFKEIFFSRSVQNNKIYYKFSLLRVSPLKLNRGKNRDRNQSLVHSL